MHEVIGLVDQTIMIVCITALIVVICSIFGLIVVVSQLCRTLIKISVIQKSESFGEAKNTAETDLEYKEKVKKKNDKKIEKETAEVIELRKVAEDKAKKEDAEWDNVG